MLFGAMMNVAVICCCWALLSLFVASGRRDFAATISWPCMFLTSILATSVAHSSELSPHSIIAIAGVVTAGVICILEFFLPYNERWSKSDGEVTTDVAHTGISAATDYITKSVISLWAWRYYYTTPSSSSLPLWLRVVLALVVGEFGGYFSHWVFHVRTLPFWQLHRVHHAVGRLSWVNTARFHPLDVLAQLLLIYPPLYLCGLGDDDVLLYYAVIFNSIGQLSHCNVRCNCGVLNYVFNTPENHRFHHMRRLKQSNSNYGQVLMIWDVALRTHYNPRTHILRGDEGMGDKTLSSAGVFAHMWWPLAAMWQGRNRWQWVPRKN